MLSPKFTYENQNGKLQVYERINLLLDKQSFMEIVLGKEEYDGVVTGSGKINGRKVYLYAQDFLYKGGSLGKLHGQKIANVIKCAIKNKVPIIGIIDSGGARIQEGINALAKYGEIFYQNTRASGLIPQISIIVGTCAGGAVYSPGITDFIFMVDKIGAMFVTGPKVIEKVTNEIVTLEELGGSQIHNKISGVAHRRFTTEEECYKGVRKLLEIIPHWYGDKKTRNYNCKINVPEQLLLRKIVPKDVRKVYDMKRVINTVFDQASFIEIQPEFAPNIIVGFVQLNNITVGIVANQPCILAGTLDCDSSDKAARFVSYCDCYNIPIITLTDVPGFFPGTDQEKKGIIKHGAKLIYAYSCATTIKINVILRKAYGGAYIAMSSKHLKADCVYAWDKAELAVMGAESAVEIIYSKTIKQFSANKRKLFIAQKVKEYMHDTANIHNALKEGYIDDIILPENTRERLYADLKRLKRRKRFIRKKHGNILM